MGYFTACLRRVFLVRDSYCDIAGYVDISSSTDVFNVWRLYIVRIDKMGEAFRVGQPRELGERRPKLVQLEPNSAQSF